MAEQVYVYGATAARQTSYSYGGYAAEAPGSVQPMYSVSVQQPGQTYSYEQSAYPATSLGAAGLPQTATYAQADYGQPAYTVQVVAASQPSYGAPTQSSGTAYAQTPSGAYAAVPVAASPYATTVVAPAAATYAPSADQQLSYGQPTYVSQPSYMQQQQGSIYAQPQAQATAVYGQLSLQQNPPAAQPATYGIPANQQTAYGQPAAQQPLPQQPYGQPGGAGQTVVIQHANPAYGQSIAQQGPPGYGAPAPQHATAAYGQPPPSQHTTYAQPPQVQLPPPPQQTVYVLPSAAPQPMQYGLQPPTGAQQQPRPTLSAPPYGRPMSPVDMVSYDQRSVSFTPGGRGPPGALVGPSVVLNAVLGGSRGHHVPFSRGRDGPRGGFGGRDRGEATEMGQMLEDTVFIQGLPESVTEELLAKHFSSVGAVKTDTRTGKPRVWICRDKVTGRPRGDGIVGYELPHTATAAIERFHRSDFLGTLINVRHASKKPNQQGGMGGGGGMLSRGRGDGTDWTCTVGNCGNQNFGWRTECNRCKAPRPGGKDGAGGGGDGVAENGSDQEDNDGRDSPSGHRGTFTAGRGGSFARGGSSVRGSSDRGRGGAIRGLNAMARGRGGPSRGGPMRGRDRFERRDHPY